METRDREEWELSGARCYGFGNEPERAGCVGVNVSAGERIPLVEVGGSVQLEHDVAAWRGKQVHADEVHPDRLGRSSAESAGFA